MTLWSCDDNLITDPTCITAHLKIIIPEPPSDEFPMESFCENLSIPTISDTMREEFGAAFSTEVQGMQNV